MEQPALSRHDRVVINRLRIGHTRFTNACVLKGENQPECQTCQSALTVKHILIDCTHINAVRQRYFRVDTLKELFEIVDSRNIIAFSVRYGTRFRTRKVFTGTRGADYCDSETSTRLGRCLAAWLICDTAYGPNDLKFVCNVIHSVSYNR